MSWPRKKAKDGRHVRLQEYMLASIAWQSLDGNSRALYVEMARRYRGPNSNNGKLPFSVREAAALLAIGKSTAQRCFDQLQTVGLIRISKRSGFNMKGRVSTEWLLTEFPDDTKSVAEPPSKDFMRWSPSADHSPTTDTVGPTSGTHRYLLRDRVA